MNINVRLAFDEGATVRLLNFLARENARIRLENPTLPLLYDAGVTYRREHGETWSDLLHLYLVKHDDCDGLAAARAGELMAEGSRALRPGDGGYAQAHRARLDQIPAEVFLTTAPGARSAGLYHCVVAYRVGRFVYLDDPSFRLGMPLSRPAAATHRRWLRRRRRAWRP